MTESQESVAMVPGYPLIDSARGADQLSTVVYEDNFSNGIDFDKWHGMVNLAENGINGRSMFVGDRTFAGFHVPVAGGGRKYRVSLQVKVAPPSTPGGNKILSCGWEEESAEGEVSKNIVVDVSDGRVHDVIVDVPSVVVSHGTFIFMSFSVERGGEKFNFFIDNFKVEGLADQLVYKETFERGLDKNVWRDAKISVVSNGIEGKSGFVKSMEHTNFSLRYLPAGNYRFSMDLKKGSGVFPSDIVRVHLAHSTEYSNVDLADGKVHTFTQDVTVPAYQGYIWYYIGRWDTGAPGGGGGPSRPIPSPDVYIDNVRVQRLQQPIGDFKPSFVKRGHTISGLSVPGFPDAQVSHYMILVWARYMGGKGSTLSWVRLPKTASYTIPTPPPPAGAGNLLDVHFQMYAVSTSGDQSQSINAVR